jgi:hypothetical protein
MKIIISNERFYFIYILFIDDYDDDEQEVEYSRARTKNMFYIRESRESKNI